MNLRFLKKTNPMFKVTECRFGAGYLLCFLPSEVASSEEFLRLFSVTL